MHTLTFGHSRYHLPLIPIVSLYAAGAITAASAIWQQRRSIRFTLAGALCALLAMSWAWELFFVDPQRYFNVL
jgi:hypothetical protein